MKKLAHLSAATLMALACASPAYAAPLWSSSANGCVPSANSVSNGRYAGVNHIFHKGTNVDPIVLTCPVDVFDTTSIGYTMALTYKDSTGTGTGASVVARLYEQSRITGATTEVVAIDSNNRPQTGVNLGEVIFVPGFNFTVNSYFVQIVLDRSTTSQVVQAYSVVILSI